MEVIDFAGICFVNLDVLDARRFFGYNKSCVLRGYELCFVFRIESQFFCSYCSAIVFCIGNSYMIYGSGMCGGSGVEVCELGNMIAIYADSLCLFWHVETEFIFVGLSVDENFYYIAVGRCDRIGITSFILWIDKLISDVYRCCA